MGHRIEERGIDPVLDDMHPLGARLRLEQLGLGLADEQARIGALGGRALVAEQQLRLRAS